MSYQQTKHFLYRKIVDEAILVPASPEARRKNELVVLNDVAEFFFLKTKEGASKSQILFDGVQEFDASEETLSKDYDNFILEMQKLGILSEA